MPLVNVKLAEGVTGLPTWSGSEMGRLPVGRVAKPHEGLAWPRPFLGWPGAGTVVWVTGMKQA
jgi:hypothetical protein